MRIILPFIILNSSFVMAAAPAHQIEIVGPPPAQPPG